jgi:hypothetical protein
MISNLKKIFAIAFTCSFVAVLTGVIMIGTESAAESDVPSELVQELNFGWQPASKPVDSDIRAGNSHHMP